MHPDRCDHPALLPDVRALLNSTGVPWVIENVEGAPMAWHPQLDGTWAIVLCGSMFGLGVKRGYLRRHRLFESSIPIPQPACAHRGVAVGVYGHGGHSGKHRMLYRVEAAAAMGIDWMTRDELSQAIPPAYTEHIGRYLLAAIHHRAAQLTIDDVLALVEN
jgi:DNA (cytosine-5)-methyltransferase 1